MEETLNVIINVCLVIVVICLSISFYCMLYERYIAKLKTTRKWLEKLDAFENIEKELAVLEILKKYLKLKTLELGIVDIVICCENEEDFKIVKEWLKNE